MIDKYKVAIMSKEKHKSVFNVAVVGLSGVEQIKGTWGVGKSCLCNRFVREEADDYYPDHTSILSQSDFGGRVVNNDHFLYWGEVVKQDDNGLEYKFNIIEQTEFIDDQSYQPHRSSSNQLYYKRCAQTKISSAEKMMYICTDQLAIESDFEVKLMPDGKLAIDGFIICVDVSHVQNRTIDDQIRFVQNCYHYLAKTKKPVVIALTKYDDAVPPYVEEVEKFAGSAGGKRGAGLPVIETSASENTNVTLAFLYLAQLIDKSRSKSKIVSFDDAARVRKELLKDAKENLENLLEQTVSDYHESWQTARRNLENQPEYLRYVELEGKNAASKIFRKHVNRLKEDFRLKEQEKYLKYLPRALKLILPDTFCQRSLLKDTLEVMKKRAQFESWFIESDELYKSGDGMPWFETEHMHSLEDRRIPEELLRTPEAEKIFADHWKALEIKQRRVELKQKFRNLLAEAPQVTPGGEWGDVSKFFKHYDFITEITETELSSIYEQFQTEIVEKAKEGFQELLYEKLEIFVSKPPLTHAGIHDILKDDPRYVAMAKLTKEREEILTRHITQATYPPSDNWGARCLSKALAARRSLKPCGGSSNSKAYSSAARWQLTPDSETLNIVLLGTDGLAHDLANAITVHSPVDEYTLDGHNHPLRTRSIDGDVTLPSNTFKTSSFSPHGCIAVYSSIKSLKYIERSLDKMVVPAPNATELPPFHGLPISILLARYSDTEKDVDQLRDAGERLATRIGCPFIDVLEPPYAYNRRFHDSQIKEAMRSLIQGIKERAGSGRNSYTEPEPGFCGGVGLDPALGPPDLRIIMCTRQDDLGSVEVALGPLLNHSSFHDLGPSDTEEEETQDTVVVVTYLGTQRRRIAVTLTSYQSARSLIGQGTPVHGFILVYDTQRKSSFAIMKVFANHSASSYPLLVLCVSPNENKPAAAAFFQQDSAAKQLVAAGNALADELQAKFVSASSSHRRQTEVYSTFFRDSWEHKEDTEAIHRVNSAVIEEDEPPIVDTPDLPVPAPRKSNARISGGQKSNSVEHLTGKSPYDGPAATDNASLRTPPSTLHFTVSSQSSYSESQATSEPGRATPASTWSAGSDDYRVETPSTSPTAGLLDNEVIQGGLDFTFTPSYRAPTSRASGGQPGKLNPDLIRTVETGIKAKVKYAAMMRQSSLADMNSTGGHQKGTGGEPPYMTVHDPSRIGGMRVLPPSSEAQSRPSTITTQTSNGVKISLDSNVGFKYSPLPRSSVLSPSSGSRRFSTRNGKRHLKTADINSTPVATHGGSSLKPSRHSTADLLSQTFTANSDGNLIRKGFASSHENLLHESPTVPAGMPSYRAVTPKEEKSIRQKQKEEEKRKKEEKKGKEKEARTKNKDKMKPGNRMLSTPVSGNKHSISDYFNKRLDDTIQGLNHMVPLFVEKCIRFIENYGLSTEGLYRIPANSKERELLIKKFDEDNNYEFVASEVSVPTVAGCVTWFFGHKNLPEPLIPYNLHDDFEEAINMPDTTLRNLAVRGVARKLPYSSYATYKFLCTHLKNVSDNEAKNKMSSENLAICWWPTLFRPDVGMADAVTKTCFRDVLHTCIVQCAFIFYNQPEV